ncbi:hypothetical protein BS47DRAFT_973215 [Hydnum rufescens UP504]|uniref:HNH nuclease domain-containing protein n=1 Tax=Hydnum rufescens UP504 TaxID=1448309 RepID=A0A9P6DX15_9AGAM|nr:hypothetical protein BS47DRAFT_973215 [Hydnum rufescens UP504]
MSNVDILLRTLDGEWIVFLSIPSSTAQRLSLRPLKWLRFIAFTVCGARGHLCVDQEGPLVNYNTSSADPLNKKYYYFSDGKYNPIDPGAFHDHITSRAQTYPHSDFHTQIIARDGDRCVVSNLRSAVCDAVHIIPASRDNMFLTKVVHARSALYDLDSNFTIHSLQNGILLTKTLHSFFTSAIIGFLQTPNFALDAEDVPYVGVGPVPPKRLTMQYLEEPLDAELNTFPEKDVVHQGHGASPPSPVLLDYMYGVAVYKHWGMGLKPSWTGHN